MVHHFALVGSTLHITASQPHTHHAHSRHCVAPVPSGTPLKTQLFKLAKI
jgi:hypothetical protein